jgi:hypothetical protein
MTGAAQFPSCHSTMAGEAKTSSRSPQARRCDAKAGAVPAVPLPTIISVTWISARSAPGIGGRLS